MTIKVPDIDVSIIPAYLKTQNEKQRILFVGQMASPGTATPGLLYESLGNANEQDALFGKKSILAAMIREAKKINGVSRMDAIPLADAGGSVAATGTIAFSGTPTEAGSIFVTIGSSINHTYELDITTASTPTTIGDDLVTAITADTASKVTAINTTGSVALTAVNKGLEGNKITLFVEGTVAGITYTVTGMASGATNPSLTTVFDVINGIRYQTLPWVSTYSTTEVISLLDGRFNVDNNILDGICIISVTDTFANLVTLGNAKNSESFAIHGNQLVNSAFHKGSAMIELDYVIASQFAAVRALRLTEDADISKYVISTNGARDNFGGAAIASLPYFNTPFYNLPLIDTNLDFTDDEISDLKDAGVFVLGNNIPRNTIISGEVVTTYKTNPAGNSDISFKYMEYVDTSSNIREYFYDNLRSEYSQTRLTEGDVIPGRRMANAQIIKAFIVGLYNDLSGVDFVLTQAGEAARNFFINNLTVVLDMEEGKATVSMMVPIVTQLRKIVVSMQIAFSTNS